MDVFQTYSTFVNNAYNVASQPTRTSLGLSTEENVNAALDESFTRKDISCFTSLVNTILPAIYRQTTYENYNISRDTQRMNNDIPSSTTIWKGGHTSATITRDGHLQLFRKGLGNLFVDDQDLTSSEWTPSQDEDSYLTDLKTHLIGRFIPIPNRINASNKEIIAGGARYLDPWPQESWVKTSLNRNWPPDPNTTAGPMYTEVDKSGQGFLINTNHIACRDIGEAYGTKPRALVTINPEDDSITLAVQQKNLNKSANIPFAPWLIAPLKVPPNKKALALFPALKPRISLWDAPSKNKVEQWQHALQPYDNRLKTNNEQTLFLIDPTVEGHQSKINSDSTNWVMYAIEGQDQAILMRSFSKHPDKFQAFVRKDRNNDRSEYIELEYTGPLVPPGKASTLVVKFDFIPLSFLTNGSITTFGETGDLETELVKASRYIQNNERSIFRENILK